MIALAPAAVNLGVPLIGGLIAGGARPLQNEDKAAIDAMVAARDYVGLYHAMYDHQNGNGDPGATMWRSKAREYSSQQFRVLQQQGVTIDQSHLMVREMERIADGDPATVESGRARVVSERPGPDYRAPLTLPPPSTVESISDTIAAAAARGDAAAQAELAARLSAGAGSEALRQTQLEQQASILPLGLFTSTTLWIVLALAAAFVLFTKVKE